MTILQKFGSSLLRFLPLFLAASAALADAGAPKIHPAQLIFAQPFQLAEGYSHLRRADRPPVIEGSVIVIEADRSLLRPRQGHQPLLFVGGWPAEPINVGEASGRVVALTPVPVSDLGKQPIFYAETGILPEVLSASDGEAALAAALTRGLAPPDAGELELARAAGGAGRSLSDFTALQRHGADLVERFSPQEVDLVRGLRAPLVPSWSTQEQGTGALLTEPTASEEPAAADLRAATGIAGLIELELAGNELTSYPFFEFVRAFNEGEPIQLAVDTGRFPQLAGATVDVYVVAAKTRDQWLANPVLVDLTGAVETVTLLAGTIQVNTLTIDAGSLDGNAGIGLGVGYDVVLDVDQDGTLTGGDAIDGYRAEAGLYVVHDLTQPGPLAVTEILYSGGAFLGQNTFYPTLIGNLGQLPLIVVSHGNGHNYQWYDHIGNHLASYGYVVMSHQNDTIPGPQTAATTTLTNTDYLLANIDTIGGGVLDGHVDSSRIVWIGHSRGGEGIVLAYDRVFNGDFTPAEYTLDDLQLLSSIAPTDFFGPSATHPHSSTFHLWVGGADADVSGCITVGQSFRILDRALETRQSISLHGVGHGDFHNGGGSSVANGPCLVGRSDTHTIMRGYLLPLVKYYAEDNRPAEEFLWRQWERFQPIGAPTSSCVVVDLYYRQHSSETLVIDDFQSAVATGTSSSGGAVTFDVSDLTEDVMRDVDNNFSHLPVEPMNGMTVAGPDDTSRGIIFTYDSGGVQFLDFESPQRNLRDWEYLSFRGCQQTRHPLTKAELGDTTFTVTLRDGSGGSSAIDFGAYGGGLEEPYQRNGCETGGDPDVGWNNEFETVRIRLTDFLHNASDLDLTDVVSVRFELGPGLGTAAGRIGLDQIELTGRNHLFTDGFESGDTTAWSVVVP